MNDEDDKLTLRRMFEIKWGKKEEDLSGNLKCSSKRLCCKSSTPFDVTSDI